MRMEEQQKRQSTAPEFLIVTGTFGIRLADVVGWYRDTAVDNRLWIALRHRDSSLLIKNVMLAEKVVRALERLLPGITVAQLEDT